MHIIESLVFYNSHNLWLLCNTTCEVDVGFVFPLSSLHLSLHENFLGNKSWSGKPINDDKAYGGCVVGFDIYAGGWDNQW